jgi:hypothetical protein
MDCAIAGEATAVAAAPTAETFKKSRRFIQASPCGAFPGFDKHFFRKMPKMGLNRSALKRALTRKAGDENATKA